VTRHTMPLLALVAVVAVAGACGGGSPSSPSAAGAVSIKGQVLGAGASAGLSASSGPSTAGGTITVTVAGTKLSTTVSVDGTFVLEGVEGGTFSLVFTSNGVEIGRVSITAAANSEVRIVVQVQASTIVVVNLEVDDRNANSGTNATASCFISGGKVSQGIELEGHVDSGTATAFRMKVNGERSSGLVDVVAAAAASYKCNGAPKGMTEAQCRATLAAGAQVHVRGTLTACSLSAASVNASEVKLQ